MEWDVIKDSKIKMKSAINYKTGIFEIELKPNTDIALVEGDQEDTEFLDYKCGNYTIKLLKKGIK